MVVGEKLTGAQCNFCHIDQIWKDHVQKESSVAKKWGHTWGFLKEEYTTLNDDIGVIRQRRGSKLPKLASKTETPLKLPPLKAPKQDTSNPFPKVTSREIGWRSGRPECKLEIYGRWGRPKCTITKLLKWPSDGVA